MSSSVDNPLQSTLSQAALLDAKGYGVFTEADLGLQIDGVSDEGLWLVEADGSGRPLRFADQVPLLTVPAGWSLGRWPDGEGPFVSIPQPSLGQANRAPDGNPPHRPGDANRDGRFDRTDLLTVLQSAKYGTGLTAMWTEGDWNEDGVFDRLDIVLALATGQYDATT